VGRVEYNTYVDRQLPRAEVFSFGGGSYPDVPPALLVSSTSVVVRTGPRALYGENVLEIDARGERVAPGDASSLPAAATELARVWLLPRRAAGRAQRLIAQFGAGPMLVAARCSRTATALSLYPGQWVTVTFTQLPDPATNVRGGTRLMQVAEVTYDGLYVDLRLVDGGTDTVESAPTLVGLTQVSGNEKHAVELTVNPASGVPVRVEYAVAETTVVTVTETDTSWVYAVMVTATATVSVNRLPSGKHIFIRGRSEPDHPQNLPSVWAFATATYVTTTAITVPASLTATGITANEANVTWTAGDSEYPTEFHLSEAAASTVSMRYVLSAGTTRRGLNGLTASSAYIVSVRHRDDYGGVSAAVTATFTTTATTISITDVPVLRILSGPPVTPPPSEAALMWEGIRVGVVPGNSKWPVEIERTNDSGGVPVTANATSLGYAYYPLAGGSYFDPQVNTGAVWYYRARYNANDKYQGPWSDWVGNTDGLYSQGWTGGVEIGGREPDPSSSYAGGTFATSIEVGSPETATAINTLYGDLFLKGSAPTLRQATTDGSGTVMQWRDDSSSTTDFQLGYDPANDYLEIRDAQASDVNAAQLFRIIQNAGPALGAAFATVAQVAGAMYIPTVAGAPTGTPTTVTNFVPVVYDRTNNRLYLYNGGWVATATLT
jgi:hypothetical protein